MAEELVPLRLLGEQLAIPLDQLARFLECSLEEARRIFNRLETVGFVESRRFLVGEQPWYWLSGSGTRFVNLHYTVPTAASLHRHRVVNEIRLDLAKRVPQGRWIARRLLDRRTAPKDRRAHPTPRLPDAVFEIGGECHAIQVFVSSRMVSETCQIIDDYSARYDAVVCFCIPRIQRLVGRLQMEHSWPKLSVHSAPSQVRKQVELSGAKRPLQQPDPRELAIIDLLAQQGRVPLDQLARFFEYSRAEVQRVVSQMAELGYVSQREILVDEPAWVWLTRRATRLSTTRLGWIGDLCPGRLALTRMANEVCLYVAKVAPEARWESRRQLKLNQDRSSSFPSAVVHIAGERHAIDIGLGFVSGPEWVSMIKDRHAKYDAVVCFCSPENRRGVERLARQYDWPKLAILDLPKAV